MKNHLLVLAIAFIGLFACENPENEDKNETVKEEEVLKEAIPQRIPIIPFEGEWTRDFQLGEGTDSIAHVYYRIGEDSIQYEMEGILPVKYTIKMDTFVRKDTRWLGKLHDVSYVVFIKQTSTNVLKIFKKKIKNTQEGLEMPIPDENARSQFTTWNAFHRTK